MADSKSIMIKKITMDELKSEVNFPYLFDEYAQESSIAGLPPVSEKMACYEMLQNTGVFHVYAAYQGKFLAGFVSIIVSVIPHYGVAIAVAESLFVGKEYRNSMAGLSLIKKAEEHAKEAGSPGILFSAPVGGRLEKMLPCLKFRHTNSTFFKEFV